MTTATHDRDRPANLGGAKTAPNKPEMGLLQLAIINKVKSIAQARMSSAWAYLVDVLGLAIDEGERLAKHRLAGTRRFSAEEVACLLRSDDGLDYLAAIMGDAEPRWWRAIKRQLRIACARRQNEIARRELQEALDADRDLATAIRRAETAMAVSDADFHQPTLDALRAFAGTPHRAVAAPARKGRR